MKTLTTMLFAVVFIGTTQAADLTVSIADPVADVTVGIDLSGVKFDFNNTTGAFTFTATANTAHPFVGNMVFNLNLYNVDAATRTTPSIGFFTSSNPRNLTTPQTTFTVSGVDSRLTSWNAGDRVAYNNVPFGAPTQFRANVYADCPGVCETDDFGTNSPNDFTTLQSVVSQSVLVNPRFDGNIAGWIPQSDGVSFDSTRNASGSQSGSLKGINAVDQSSNPFCDNSAICVTVFPAQQCLQVTPGVTYQFGGKIYIPSGQSSSGQGGIGISFWANANCAGNFVGSSDGSPVTSTGSWMSSSGRVQAPIGAVSVRVLMNNGRIQKTGTFRVNFDDIFFEESTAAACPLTEIGHQVPLQTTGFTHNFKGSGEALGFIGTNVGATPVLNPFVLILDYRTGTGSAVTLESPITTCLSANPLHYVPLLNISRPGQILKPGEKAKGAAIFHPPNSFYGGVITSWQTWALSGLR